MPPSGASSDFPSPPPAVMVRVQKFSWLVPPSSERFTLIVTPSEPVLTSTVVYGVFQSHSEPVQCANPYDLSDWSTTKKYSAPRLSTRPVSGFASASIKTSVWTSPDDGRFATPTRNTIVPDAVLVTVAPVMSGATPESPVASV